MKEAEMFDDPFKNTLYIGFHHVAVVISIIVNMTLITCILTCRRKEFGSYRYLLLTFASVDLYYALVHFIVMPTNKIYFYIPEGWANAFYMGAHGYVKGRFAVCWFAGAHSHSFPVLVFHFLYRLLAVKGSSGVRLFNRPWFYVVQFAFVALIAVAWFCVLYYLYDADEFVKEYMAPILREHAIGTSLSIDQYSTAVFWKYGTFCGPRWKPICGVLIMFFTMGGCYGFMIYAAYKIAWYTRINSKSQSMRTIRMQQQLMKALSYQTILPLITAYSPPLISIMNPFLGITLPIIADLSPILCGSHPWIDGCVLLWTIKAYRMMLLQCLRRRMYPRQIGPTTIAVQGSHTTSK